ncbi:hypothetical protein CRU86_08545 [Aliarcobacter skirrowii]|nr:hypothetical protein CRU86_08545 [Aliarcobacter skirrowii]
MDNNTITAFATFMLVIVGITQVKSLTTQNRQSQLIFIEEYRKRWLRSRKDWGVIVFLGRNDDDYYQVVKDKIIKEFILLRDNSNLSMPSVWALDSARIIFTLMNDICIKLLKNQIKINDVYPIFGTELLRNSNPLRKLLEKSYYGVHSRFNNEKHNRLRREIQDWLIYHDGVRRRCLILIDLLWAEASRLEDLPPYDVKSAAEAKLISGEFCRNRIYKECKQLNNFFGIFIGMKLSHFLKHSEYKTPCSNIGVDKNKLVILEKEWVDRLLNKIN